MAHIRYTNGKQAFMSEHEAEKLWRILDGQAKPASPAQRRYVDQVRRTVKKVTLNYHTAPDDYIRKNLHNLLPQIMADWLVDRNGHPLRPANEAQRAFARKFGLIKGNRPTPVVTVGQLTLV